VKFTRTLKVQTVKKHQNWEILQNEDTKQKPQKFFTSQLESNRSCVISCCYRLLAKMTAERGSKRVAPEKEDHISSKRVSKNKEKEQISLVI
jgi:hypothetical protein